MSARKLAATALCTSVIILSLTLWIAGTPPSATPTPVTPRLLFSGDQGGLVVWGAWNTTRGYNDGSTAATEIRCSLERMTCVEGTGRLLIHDEGQDLEAAQVKLYW